jgi:hypothetical protein
MADGNDPTLMGMPGMLVAVLMGVTVPPVQLICPEFSGQRICG